MKISYNWLSTYVDHQMEPEALGELMTSLGLEVEGMEAWESVKGGLKGIVTGSVTECVQHPNADKLKLTRVDIGGDELLSIVCGAPNVAAGQKVLVATVGTSLYDPEGKPWTIKKAKIRGERSEGMICAEDELGLGDSHDGIIVLPDNIQVGVPAAELFDVEHDIIYEIGLTPNRSDATAHLGSAKDVLAALRVRMNRNIDIIAPELADIEIASSHPGIVVELSKPELSPRFSMLLLKNIKIGPGPDWMKRRLESIGVRSINNVVDITNFVLHEYGQPLHAYDYNTLPGHTIVVDSLADGTPFKALDEVERKMDSQDLMICDKDRNPIGIAGVFGGLSTGVTDVTREVLLEAAHFNAISVRKTSTRHNLRTEAAKCFEKGSDPRKTIEALRRAAYLLQEYAGATIEGSILDVYPEAIEAPHVEVQYEYIQRLTGNPLSSDEIKKILGAMDMAIIKSDDMGLTVEVPTDKADVTRPADILEEILRVHGYDHIHPDDKLHLTLIPKEDLELYEFKELVANYLSANGFHQMMNMSLSQSKYYPDAEGSLVNVLNTSNVHLDIMRPEMLVTGLEAIAFNINRRQTDLKLYELGHTYERHADSFHEEDRLAIYATGKWSGESWTGDADSVDYYDLSGTLTALLRRFGVDHTENRPTEDKRFSYGLEFDHQGNHIATVGMVSKALCNQTDIDTKVYAIDLSLTALYNAFIDSKVLFEPISKYPGSRRDIALVLDKTISYDAICETIRSRGKKLIRDINLFDVYEHEEQLGPNKKSYAISLMFEHPEKTLTDKEIDKAVKKILDGLASNHGATLR